MSMKHSNDTIRNLTRGHPTCSAAPQPTTPPRAPTIINDFNVHGYVHCKNILIYIQHDATSHSLFYLENVLHVSGGTKTHHQERKQLYLQHLVFVTPLLPSAAIVEELQLQFQLFHLIGR
jgi:hypothetical protein